MLVKLNDEGEAGFINTVGCRSHCIGAPKAQLIDRSWMQTVAFGVPDYQGGEFLIFVSAENAA